MNPEIEKFAEALVREVRDSAIRSCDMLLQPNVGAPVAKRWRASGVSVDAVRIVIPDIVDEVVSNLLRAIDQGSLQVRFSSNSGCEVDLTQEGFGELSGWYMGSGGWRARLSHERFVDDFADLR